MQAPRARLPEDVVRLIKAEFLEMPGLCLTEPQVRRLWTLEPSLCSQVLTGLVQDGFLLRSPSGKFIHVEGNAVRQARSTDVTRARPRAIA